MQFVSLLGTRNGPTDLQVMHISRADGKSIEVSVDSLTYIHSDDVDEVETFESMDEVARNLFSFKLDHDYTPLTSPRQSPAHEIDELAATLSMLDGANPNTVQTTPVKTVKVIKTTPKAANKKPVTPQTSTTVTRAKTKATADFKQPTTPTVKQNKPKEKAEEVEQPAAGEEDVFEEDDQGDDDNDSDYELEEPLPKQRPPRRTRRNRSKSQSETKKVPKPQQQKTATPKSPAPKVPEPEPKVVEKVTEPPATVPEVKPPEKKQPKKDKKPPKPIPEDFALFSTPDIIRRVGGKEPTTPESPLPPKPAKISPESRSKSTSERNSLNSKSNRSSTDAKTIQSPEVKTASPEKPKVAVEPKIRRVSTEKPKVIPKLSPDKSIEARKLDPPPNPNRNYSDMVQIQNLNDSTNSSEMLGETIDHMPTAEDIRSIILNENTKSYTTSLVLPDTNEMSNAEQQNLDHNNMNLEGTGLDLDQSILDNISSDMISDDILYQVAKQLVDNADLQNVIDKSLADGNLVLDPSIQNAMIGNDHEMMLPVSQTNQVSDVEVQEVYSFIPKKVKR